MSSRFRYTGTSAAVNTWDQQEDDRGPGGLFRLLGEGTSPPQHNQRWVPPFFFFLLSIYPNLAENIPSFFFSFLFFSLFFVPFSLCTFHGVQVSRRFLIILSLPRHGDLWRFRLEKHIFFFTYRFIDCLVRLCVSDFFFFSLLLVSMIFFFVNIYRSILK